MTLNVGDYFERIVGDECTTYPSFTKGYRGKVARITDGCIWDDDGCGHSYDNVRKIDPPNPSPVRTVTRKEIVPGTYGIVNVAVAPGYAATWIENRFYSPAELRAAASTLIEIADALGDTK